MFDVGFAELFLLSLIGLMVLGPERLPAVARTLGGFMRKARHSWYNLKRTVEAEMAAAEATQSINDAKKELESVQAQVAQIGRDLNEVTEEARLDAATRPSADQDDPEIQTTETQAEPPLEPTRQAALNLEPDGERRDSSSGKAQAPDDHDRRTP